LDRKTGDACLDAKPHIFRDALRLPRITGFEVGVHGQFRRSDNLRKMTEYQIARRRVVVVRQSLREGEPGAGGGQRLKSEMAQIAGRAGVPGIRNDETAAFVQLSERGAARREIGLGHMGKELNTTGSASLVFR